MQAIARRGHGPGRRVLLASALLCSLVAIAPATAVADDELDYGLERRRLASLEFRGNNAVDDDRLRELMPFSRGRWYQPFADTRYRRDELAQGVATIEAWYIREGFHSARVELASLERGDEGDSVVVAVREGPRTLVGELRIEGEAPLDEERLRRRLLWQQGGPAPARPADLAPDALELAAAFRARGHLAVEVQESMARRDSVVDIRYDIVPGPVYVIREVVITGEQRIREDYIRRELRLNNGDRFDLGRIALTEEDLLETGWFRDVSFVPARLDTSEAEAVMELRVVERPTGFYEVGVGTGDEDRFRLTGAWGERNLFGWGRSLTLRARLFWSVQDRFARDGSRLVLDHEEEALYRAPHAFGSPFDLGLNAFFRQETRSRAAVILERSGILANTAVLDRGRSTLELEGGIERVRKRPLDLEAGEEALLGRTRATTHSMSVVGTRDTRNDLFQPRRGSISQLLLQTAGGPVLGGDNDFHKALASHSRFRPLGGGVVLGLRLQAGWAEEWWTTQDEGTGVPLEDRFFAGGSNSVRGYRENSLGPRLTPADSLNATDPRFLANRPSAGGEALLLANAELRFPLPLLARWGFAGAAFFDAGNVWSEWDELSAGDFRLASERTGDDPTTLRDLRTSIGLSLYYNTPVGPLRLDYGAPLKRLRLENAQGEVEEDPAQVWHFSLGHAF